MDFFAKSFVFINQKLNRSKYRAWCNQEIEFYISNPDSDKLRGIIIEVDEIKEIMAYNLEKIVERGAK